MLNLDKTPSIGGSVYGTAITNPKPHVIATNGENQLLVTFELVDFEK